MKIIILAAGRGSRLGLKTQDKPKCMCTLGGITLIDRAMHTLEQAGVAKGDIGIVTGYKREMFNIADVTYFHSAEWESTNMFVSLTKAREWLQKEDCIVCYSDIVFSPKAVKTLMACQADVALTYYTGYWALWSQRLENPLDDLETFKLDEQGWMREIGLKPESPDDIQGQYMGLMKFTPQGWQQVEQTIKQPLPKSVEKLDMTTLLNGMINQGYPVLAIGTDDLWLECDTERDIDVYEASYADELQDMWRR